MRSNWTKLTFILVFLFALGGGVTVGLVGARLAAERHPPTTAVSADSPLAEQLALSDEQRQQMRKIWACVRDISDESYQSALAAKSDEDRAIVALIPAEKQEEYRKIERDFTEKCAGLKGRRQAAFEKAVNQTRQILSQPQREKYDAILKQRLGPEGEVREHDPMSPRESVSTMKPAAERIALID